MRQAAGGLCDGQGVQDRRVRRAPGAAGAGRHHGLGRPLLGPGQRGEIVVRSFLVMVGYYKDPGVTARQPGCQASTGGPLRGGAAAHIGVCDAKWHNLDRARRLVIAWTAQL